MMKESQPGDPRPIQSLHSNIPGYDDWLERLPAAAFTCDVEGLVTGFNERAVRLWGRKPALRDPAVRYCGSMRLFSTRGVPMAHHECWTARALRDGREYCDRRIVIERPDGSRRTVSANATPLLDRQGHLVGAINVLVDLTEQSGALRADLDLSRIKHDINNTVHVLELIGELLKNVPESEMIEQIRQGLGKEISTLTRLVETLQKSIDQACA